MTTEAESCTHQHKLVYMRLRFWTFKATHRCQSILPRLLDSRSEIAKSKKSDAAYLLNKVIITIIIIIFPDIGCNDMRTCHHAEGEVN